MTLFTILRKNWKLRGLMKRLAARTPLSQVLEEKRGGKRSDEEIAREQLFALVLNDPDLRQIMNHHGADEAKLREYYRLLMVSGAGQWAGGAFVAAAAIATNPTLIYLLNAAVAPLPASATERGRWLEISLRLTEYYRQGKLGPVA